MSIFFEYEVGSKARRFRLAVEQDVADIVAIWKREETATLFNADNIGSLIELSVLAICMINEDKAVTGFIALSDYPPIPCVDPGNWEVWIRNMFQRYYLSYNSLFIHFMCCKDSVTEYFLEEALVSVFMNDFYLQNIIMVVPPTCQVDCLVKYPTFKRRTVYKHCSKFTDDVEDCMMLFVAVRQDFCPKLKVRRAVEEDNDEVVELLDKTCTKLRELYGDYYISEILGRHPEMKRSIIVAEQQDKIVGMMCLNEDVNYTMLQQTYKLDSFRGLVQTDYITRDHMKRNNSLLTTFGIPIMSGRFGPFDSIQTEKQPKESNDKVSTKDRTQNKEKSKELTLNSFRPKRQWDGMSEDSIKLEIPTLRADRSLLLLMDDEPLDYEIVNIDTKHLTLRSIDISPAPSSRGNSNNLNSIEVKRKKSFMHNKNKEEDIIKGEPNAFIIELFGMRTNVDERRAFDLLEAAFERMPNYDYCIIRIPCAQKAFPLLHHFCFVPQKSNVCCEYALYIAHRNSVLGRFRIRKAEFADIPQIATLFCKIDGKETLKTIEHSIVYSKHGHLAYVFLCGTSIIGVGILDPPDHVDLIRAKFVLDKFQHQKYHMAPNGLECGAAMVKTVLVYPAFEPHYNYFAREMLRLSGSTSLMWLTAYRNKWVTHKANSIVTVMTPLPYRVCGHNGFLPDLNQVYDLSKKLLSFSAWYISKKMTSIPRLNVDTRIVVVGASKTAISFLETLIFGESSTYLTFTNVTLVSTNGLPYLRQSHRSAEIMLPRSHLTSDRFLKSTPFTFYVNVVNSTVVGINRQNKYVVTKRDERIYYDLLFLLNGKQYQHPQYFRCLVEREKQIREGNIPQYVRMDDPSHKDAQLEPPTDYNIPDNVFLINSIVDASNALNTIKTSYWNFEEFKICVYGACYEAYCCISGLLESNVKPENIVYVEPFPPENESKPRVMFFCNSKVDETLRDILFSFKITCHRGFYFDSWICDIDDNMVSSVDFVSYHQMLRVKCSFFFYYGKKDINPHAFVAINKCGLAYDGGILIDHQFQTNDPSIYGAGPATRYFRRYFASLPKFFSSSEVGIKLGQQIRNLLDPLFIDKTTDYVPKMTKICSGIFARSAEKVSSWSEDSYKLKIPKFIKPLVVYCMFPGNVQYLEVRPPGQKHPHYYIQSLDYNGYSIETFESGYFRLHLSNLHVVDGITCLASVHYPIEKFKMLYGKSAVVLNNVHFRYRMGMINDFFKFFSAPWSGFFYNDRSEELLTVIKYLRPKGATVEDTLEQFINNIRMGSNEINSSMRSQIRSFFERSKYFQAIAEFITEWVNDNNMLFPVYATPSHITEYSSDGFECLPPFKKKKKTVNHMLSIIIE